MEFPDDPQAPGPEQHHVFVVRIRHEPASGAPIRRVTVKHPEPGQRVPSIDLNAIEDFIRLRIDPHEGAVAGHSHEHTRSKAARRYHDASAQYHSERSSAMLDERKIASSIAKLQARSTKLAR